MRFGSSLLTWQEFEAMERIYTIGRQRLKHGISARVMETMLKKLEPVNGFNGLALKQRASLGMRILRYFCTQETSIRLWFPEFRPHAPNTLPTPPRRDMSVTGRWLWFLSKRPAQRDAKYAIKTGMATTILAAPAFRHSTRLIGVGYYRDWALTSVGTTRF
ncbi:hypothetical protein VNI00_013476 [Paramarasmius palmivorus]|uniref:Uncharacterized protein n=1 Tax=Paramarasmius palmivorus TaxID=297713 RepID=A0AAW0BZW5_9AGAR